jgi:metacaspase-1
MNKALLVGINKYPVKPLKGCINDINDTEQLISKKRGFLKSDIRSLTDKAATKKGIIEQLDWLLGGVRAGHRILFYFSGHGVRIPIRDPQGDGDTIHDAICPIDFSWKEARPETHAITDTDFKKIFSKAPAGIEFVWISDSCHSGHLIKALAAMPSDTIYKTIAPPPDIERRLQDAQEKAIQPMGFMKAIASLNVALIAACESKQTAADALFNGRANGVLTKFLLDELNAGDGLQESLTKLVTDIRPTISKAGYKQIPQLEGSPAIVARAFLATK